MVTQLTDSFFSHKTLGNFLAVLIMTIKTAQVQQNQLYLDQTDTPTCALDSPAWFAWLAQAHHFRYHATVQVSVHRGYCLPARPISVRKEKRRHGYFWYAYLRSHQMLHKRYLGKSAMLTAAKLDEIATILNQLW